MDLLSFLLWVVLGGIAGWIASLIMGTDAQQGTGMNVVVGVIGAILGGLVMNFFGAAGTTGFNLYSLIVAVIGAVILLFLVKMFRRAA